MKKERKVAHSPGYMRAFEKDMKKIAKGIFGYNPKTDPNDPLFGKASRKEAEKRK